MTVGTTPRKALTPSQRLRLFEEHGGLCALCARKIEAGERWRDEHLRALGLGGSNDFGNRAPVHEKCAALKDADDLPRIAKAKRQKRAHLGIRKPPSRLRHPMLRKKMNRDVVRRDTGELVR